MKNQKSSVKLGSNRSRGNGWINASGRWVSPFRFYLAEKMGANGAVLFERGTMCASIAIKREERRREKEK